MTGSQVGSGVSRMGVGGRRQAGVQPDDQHINRSIGHRRDPTIWPMLVWMDLEMTGLDASTDVIVEIATLVTDDELRIVAEGPDLVVHQPPQALDHLVPVVQEMHTASGLLDAIAASTTSLEEAGRVTLDFIRSQVPKERSVPLCGNSIGTDRRFLAAYLPEIEQYLHYRSVDVSTVKELARRWYPDVVARAPRKGGSHRAMDDIRESVAELRYYRDRIFRPATSATAGAPDGDHPPAPPIAAV